jgi:hypothetical protein
VAVASAAKDWGPIIIGILGVLTGLVTFLYGIRAQREARRLEYEHERDQRLDDKTLEAAADLAGSLTAVSSGLHYIPIATAMETLDAVETHLNEAELQQGHLSLFLGNRHPLCVAAVSAIQSYRAALGWAREEQAPSREPDAASIVDATTAKDENLSEASADMERFWRAAREAGITRDVRLGAVRS